jgi:hypothetical protein
MNNININNIFFEKDKLGNIKLGKIKILMKIDNNLKINIK